MQCPPGAGVGEKLLTDLSPKPLPSDFLLGDNRDYVYVHIRKRINIVVKARFRKGDLIQEYSSLHANQYAELT